MPRELWHERSGPRLPGGPKAGVIRNDGTREALRVRRQAPAECYRCAEDRRRLTAVRVVGPGGATLGTTLLCGECVTALVPLDPDPLTVDEALV